MNQVVEVNQGEIRINFSEPVQGKTTLEDLGLSDNDLVFEGGLLRMVFDFEGMGPHRYYSMPTIEIAYKENMAETHWLMEFNENTILDKTDHHGRSTVILMSRKKWEESEHHHENKLILHAEFPGPVHLIAADSYINFFV